MNKVLKSDLLRFIDLIKLKGEIESKSVILNITKNTIEAPFIVPESRVLSARGSFTGEDIEEIGEVCIVDLKQFKDYVNTFNSDTINIIKKNNKLELSSDDEKLKISMVLLDSQYLKASLPKNKTFKDLLTMIPDNKFSFTKEQVQKFVKYTSVLTPNYVYFEGKDKTVTLKLSANENKLSTSFTIPQQITPFKIKLSNFFIDLLSIINDSIIISTEAEKPVYVKYVNGVYNIEYILASLKME